jgi:hypothetical protein
VYTKFFSPLVDEMHLVNGCVEDIGTEERVSGDFTPFL